MITKDTIRQLAQEAAIHGDLLQWALCAHALGELDNDLYPAPDPGTDADDVLASYTPEQAWQACEEAIEEAEGQEVN